MSRSIPPRFVLRLGIKLAPTFDPKHRSGNYAQGERHPRCKLTDQDVELFRQLVESGVSQAEACRKFEISKSQGSKLMSYSQRAEPTWVFDERRRMWTFNDRARQPAKKPDSIAPDPAKV